MSVSRLRAFAEQAERLVDLPDVEALERRGNDVRARRRTTAVAAALLVAIGGTAAVQERFQRADEPDNVDTPGRPVMQYPGNQMQDLDAGTYELSPSSVRGEPTALITLPSGWNSWEGPNRFEEHEPGDPTSGMYEVGLGRINWYVGVLVVKVLGVGRDLCPHQPPHTTIVSTVQETVEALGRIRGFRPVGEPEQVVAFGYPGVHLAFRAQHEKLDSCGPDEEAPVYYTSANRAFGGAVDSDVWVLDVEGVPITVIRARSGDVPARVLAELDAVVDSIEIHTHED